jgi:enediyne biosynthesis protein E4
MLRAVALLSLAVLTGALAQPTMDCPGPQSCSLGATVTFQLRNLFGQPPYTYAWRHNDVLIDPATNATAATPRLVLTNVGLTDAGPYQALVTDVNGTATCDAALDVDPAFTKITQGDILNGAGEVYYGTWVDYDNDGWVDWLVVGGWFTPVAGSSIRLYHNNGDGTFTKITAGPLGNSLDRAGYAVWADYDNDGNLDVLMSPDPKQQPCYLYHNRGNGNFTKSPISGSSNVRGYAMAWGDYDADGFVDMAVGTGFYPERPPHFLLRNGGDGTFGLVTNAWTILTDMVEAISWVDYDNDGRLDLFPTDTDSPEGTNTVYRNLGGDLQATGAGDLTQDQDRFIFGLWGDYDNDGNLDVLMEAAIEFSQVGTYLYRNLGDGTFTRVSTAFTGLTDCGQYGAWADYDNDGYLDLFLAGFGGRSRLFRNQSDGTFEEILRGSPVNDSGSDTALIYAGSWADYDHNGFLDLMMVRDKFPNMLYRNNGNTNHWLQVKLVGTASNRSAIGAKVRATATIGGKTILQLRVIQAQTMTTELIAHFGLGDATKVETLRIEWPSGIVQTLTDVPAGQFLTVAETQSYTNASPQFSGVTSAPGGFQLSMTEPAASATYTYILEASTDLVSWTKLMARKSVGGTAQFTDTHAASFPSRYYRLQVP